jgi:hypothetical protein
MDGDWVMAGEKREIDSGNSGNRMFIMMMVFEEVSRGPATLISLQQVLAIHYDNRIKSFDSWFHEDD